MIVMGEMVETTTDFAFRKKPLKKELKLEENAKICYAPLALGTNTRYKLITNPSYVIPNSLALHKSDQESRVPLLSKETVGGIDSGMRMENGKSCYKCRYDKQ